MTKKKKWKDQKINKIEAKKISAGKRKKALGINRIYCWKLPTFLLSLLQRSKWYLPSEDYGVQKNQKVVALLDYYLNENRERNINSKCFASELRF